MKTNPYTDGTYLDKVNDWHVGDSPWKASKVLQMIARHDVPCRTVYDVGCGAGAVLVELQRALGTAAEMVGFDISPQAIALAKPRENARLRFCHEDFFTAAVPLPDLVLLLDVFEHVPDYLGFLDALRKRTDWIILHIPLDIGARSVLGRSRWMLYMRETYGHLHYFTKETALATLADAGFRVLDHFYTDDFEVSDAAIPGALRQRVSYEVRKRLFRSNPGLAAALFNHFNLMVLARGDGKGAASSSGV